MWVGGGYIIQQITKISTAPQTHSNCLGTNTTNSKATPATDQPQPSGRGGGQVLIMKGGCVAGNAGDAEDAEGE